MVKQLFQESDIEGLIPRFEGHQQLLPGIDAIRLIEVKLSNELIGI